MRALAWTLFFVALLAGSGWYLWRRARPLPGLIAAAAEEIHTAQTRLAEVESTWSSAGMPLRSAADLAVFTRPAQARRDRNRIRAQSRQARQARRLAALPGWARRAMPRGYTAPGAITESTKDT